MELREYLCKMGIPYERVEFICGYFADKPEYWKQILMLRASGKTQSEIADGMQITQPRVTQVETIYKKYLINTNLTSHI